MSFPRRRRNPNFLKAQKLVICSRAPAPNITNIGAEEGHKKLKKALRCLFLLAIVDRSFVVGHFSFRQEFMIGVNQISPPITITFADADHIKKLSQSKQSARITSDVCW